MNALGANCRAVLLIAAPTTDAAEVSPSVWRSTSCGYHFNCVYRTTTTVPSPTLVDEMIASMQLFCETSSVQHAIASSSEAMEAMQRGDSALQFLSAPVTILPATTATASQLLHWLVGPAVVKAEAEHFTLVAVVDGQKPSFGVPAGVSHTAGTSTAFDWIRPRQSYVSELTEAASMEPERVICDSLHGLVWVPVSMYSRCPVLRDRGVEHGHSGGAAMMVKTCTLAALLRELSFKAGQLPKYGA